MGISRSASPCALQAGATALNTVYDQALDNRGAAAVLGISPSTLNKARMTGDSPPFYKIGGRVVYRLGEIQAWLDTKRRRSTSDEGGRA
ncbi:MAG: helix-turn-helix transcriptional regulator [Rhodomicrobium sp.]